MRGCFRIIILTILLLNNFTVKSQTDRAITDKGYANTSVLNDSLIELEQQNTESELRKARIDSLQNVVYGYPIILSSKDTLFFVHSDVGEFTPEERASRISKRINKLLKDDFLEIDSIVVVKSDNTFDIVYFETIIMRISEVDAMWYDKSAYDLANVLCVKIKDSIIEARINQSLIKLLERVGLVSVILAFLVILIWLVGRGYAFSLNFIKSKKSKIFKKISYKGYTFIKAEQEMKISLLLLKILRWFLYALLLYISLPIIFNIFPFSRNWSHAFFKLLWSPLRGVLLAVWEFLPNLITILVIYFVMKYFIRFVKYIFFEIEAEKLKIPGFYSDWARPTFSIVKIFLYAFVLILIFPYLPGSDSNIFKGVSIFIGVLFSLGSSSAVGNMIAGLMITYMRPFKVGDRIEISNVTGDVVERTLLVTRLRTAKNEVITIPNSSVLSRNTVNYTSGAKEKGLIIHTTVTIGYDVPWKNVHQALIDAALLCELILQEPPPFVHQTSLDDFYVSYQINAYTKEASKQGSLYSNLHQNIQNVCRERGIEILSPHYEATRDGSMSSIPLE